MHVGVGCVERDSQRRDDMFLEVARPVRGLPTGATAGADLEGSFGMSEFHPEPRECFKCVDDQSTPVVDVVFALVKIWPRLDGKPTQIV